MFMGMIEQKGTKLVMYEREERVIGIMFLDREDGVYGLSGWNDFKWEHREFIQNNN